ncbi:MAG: hypothetical protein ABIO70_13455 [Pseudomonadota bacterium]
MRQPVVVLPLLLLVACGDDADEPGACPSFRSAYASCLVARETWIDGELAALHGWVNDAEGDAVRYEVDSDADGVLDSVSEYEHDARGNMTYRVVDEGADGTPDAEYAYTWSDDDRFLTAVRTLDEGVEVLDTWTRAYEGEMLVSYQYDAGTDGVLEAWCDIGSAWEGAERVETWSCFEDDDPETLAWQETHRYDARDNELESWVVHDDGWYVEGSTARYDEDCLLLGGHVVDYYTGAEDGVYTEYDFWAAHDAQGRFTGGRYEYSHAGGHREEILLVYVQTYDCD